MCKRARRQAVEINKLLAESKQYALKNQMIRASVSVPSNIAEGCERDSRLDFIRFLRIAKGTAAELRTQLYIAQRLEMLSKPDLERLIQESKEIAAMLQGLIRSLARRAAAAKH